MGECGAPGDVNSNVLISCSTGDAQLDKAVWQWLSWDKVGVWLRLGGCPPSRGCFVIGPIACGVTSSRPVLCSVPSPSALPQEGPFPRVWGWQVPFKNKKTNSEHPAK